MTVNSLTNSAGFATDGINRLFPFYFKFLDKKDLVVAFVNSAGVGTTLTLNVDYTVSGEGSEGGGQVTTTVAPAALGRLVVAREMEATQKTALRNQGRFFAEVHETVFDRLTMLLQQAMALAGRALRTSTLEPGGIDPLPLEARRADKLLAFDAGGQPTASNLTLAQLEQQPALAMEAAEAAVAAADAAGVSAGNSAASAISANASKNAAAGSATAAAASAKSAADAGIQLGMSSWGYRDQPFKGFGLDDGQELDRALYPDFAAALDAGLMPVVSQALWDSVPANRACFVANSSPGKFRMRDRNGISAGSLGAVFERGGSGSVLIKQDQFQGHKFDWMQSGSSTGGATLASINVTAAGLDTGVTYPKSPIGKIITDGANGTPRFGSETYPTHATGAWMTRLFGIITPLGSAEAASLATAYASIASRVAVLEARPTYRKWTSEPLLLNAGVREFGHSLGVLPALASVTLTLKVAVQGWQAGAVFYLASSMFAPGTPSYGHQISNMSELGFTITVGTGGFIIMNGSSYIAQSLVPSQVDVRVELKAWV